MTKVAFVAVAAGAAFAGVSSATVFTTQASFLAQLAPGHFLNNFGSVGGGASGPLNFSGNGFSYIVDAPPGGLFNNPGVISTNNATDPIVITFTGGNPTAVGGNFWATDINFNPISATVTINTSDGQSRSFTASSPSDFTGFTSAVAITSMMIATQAGPPTAWPTMDNLYVGQVIPTPGAAALLGLAGVAGLRRRR